MMFVWKEVGKKGGGGGTNRTKSLSTRSRVSARTIFIRPEGVAPFMPFIVKPVFSLEITHCKIESLGQGVKKRKWFFCFFSVRGVSVVKKQQFQESGIRCQGSGIREFLRRFAPRGTTPSPVPAGPPPPRRVGCLFITFSCHSEATRFSFAQALAFPSPAWRGRVARQGRERASYRSARSAAN
jgi:hypothetical protein